MASKPTWLTKPGTFFNRTIRLSKESWGLWLRVKTTKEIKLVPTFEESGTHGITLKLKYKLLANNFWKKDISDHAKHNLSPIIPLKEEFIVIQFFILGLFSALYTNYCWVSD